LAFEAFLHLEQRAPVVVKIYSHIYPLWDIAFALFFDYTVSQNESLVAVNG